MSQQYPKRPVRKEPQVIAIAQTKKKADLSAEIWVSIAAMFALLGFNLALALN